MHTHSNPTPNHTQRRGQTIDVLAEKQPGSAQRLSPI
jgi:hypothetical protein